MDARKQDFDRSSVDRQRVGAAAAGHAQHRRHFRPDIQGLRAIAVLSVVVYHANAAWAPGGFVGVDVFFVISGYLITGILLSEMDRGTYSLTGFYERRVRRLFPALFTMLAAVLAAAALVVPPIAYKELAHTAFWTVFFTSNLSLSQQAGYFNIDSSFKPLLHTWSLAVEEQFYLVFPLFLFVTVKLARRRLRLVLAVAAAASLAACVWALGRNPNAAFYLSQYRGYELLTGALIAGVPWPARVPGWIRHALSRAGLALIAASLLAFDDDTPFPGVAALAPCLGAACVLFAGAGAPSLGGRLISGRAFSWFGDLSYSLYLWHWPVLVLGESMLLHKPTPWQAVCLMALAVGLAALSWRYVEQPFLHPARPGRRRALIMGGTAMLVASAAAVAIVKLGGFPQRFSPPAAALIEASDDYSPYRNACHEPFHDSFKPYRERCVLGAAKAEPHVAVWGDSHGVEFGKALADRLAAHGRSLLQVTGSACPPVLGSYGSHETALCQAYNSTMLHALATDPRIDAVVVATNIQSYPRGDWAGILAGEARALDVLRRSGKRVVLLGPYPVFDYDVPTALGVRENYGAPLAMQNLRRRTFEADLQVEAALLSRERKKGAFVIDPTPVFCDAARCFAYRSGLGVLYFNMNHMSETAARAVVARVPLRELS
jgi:peptidoglycan/LPS O-acetylase OafA/YrhL